MNIATSRRAVAIGFGVALLYVGFAVVSGLVSPLARRPLLDGFAPPALYRFVKPPPNLASINKPPLSGQFTLPVRGGTVTEGLFATRDSQASILIFRNTVLAPAGARSMTITLQPLAPAGNASVPDGMSITGNVYRITLAFQPGGENVKKLEKDAILTLTYPALAGPHHSRQILSSTNGVRYARIRSIDSTVQQQVTGHVRSPGFFAVGVKASSVPPAQAPGSGSSRITVIVVVVAVILAVLIGWLRWRERRR